MTGIPIFSAEKLLSLCSASRILRRMGNGKNCTLRFFAQIAELLLAFGRGGHPSHSSFLGVDIGKYTFKFINFQRAHVRKKIGRAHV